MSRLPEYLSALRQKPVKHIMSSAGKRSIC